MRTFLFSAFAISALWIAACATWINNEPFDSAKWKNGNRRDRGKMAYSLCDTKILVGKTPSEVIEQLGNPDYSIEGTMGYYIDTYIPIDIHFDVRLKDGKLISSDIGD